MLNVTRYGYEQLIADRVLDPPIREEGKHPYHTQSQLQRAQEKLFLKGQTNISTRPRTIKPISPQMREKVQRARAGK